MLMRGYIIAAAQKRRRKKRRRKKKNSLRQSSNANADRRRRPLQRAHIRSVPRLQYRGRGDQEIGVQRRNGIRSGLLRADDGGGGDRKEKKREGKRARGHFFSCLFLFYPCEASFLFHVIKG